ncbi:MAG: parvulin peptidyl-prolyl isomerase [Actinophytocola sp.]|nr:parvulin peptidyl-prolyl isomerase [Actinophytocola sp.]
MNDTEQQTPVIRRRITVAIAATIMLVGGVLAVVWQPWAGLPDGAAFAIGDRTVSEDALDERAETLRALYGVEPPEDQGKLDAFRRDVAKSVAVSMLLDQLASEQRIGISEKQARDVLDRFIANRYADGGREAFVKELGEAGTSEVQVLAEIKRQLAVGRLMDRTGTAEKISDNELRAEFDKRQHELGTPERRKLRNIVVKSEAKARAVLGELRTGASIATLAAEHSIDGSTRKAGGLLGTLSERELEPAVAKAAFGAEKGEFYGPVRGQFGWNVGRVEAIEPAVPADFEQVRDEFRTMLRTERAFAHWRSWLGQQIREADITYADRYRPADPDAPPSSDISGTVGDPSAGTGPR